jgi:hypothetical protein
MHIAELIPVPNLFEVEITVEKLKRYKSPGIDQILAEVIKQEVIYYILRSTNFLILFGIRKNCHDSGRNLLLYLFTKRVIKLLIGVTNYMQNFILSIVVVSRLAPNIDKLFGDHQYGLQCNRSTTDHIFCIFQVLE